jgi:hypothetical protein
MNESAAPAAAQSLRRAPTRGFWRALGGRFAAPVLALAGLLVMGGNGWGYWEWGNNRTAGLTLIVTAILLGVAVLATARGNSELPAQAALNNRLVWLLAALVAVHCAGAWFYERAEPGDNIDCYTFQRAAAADLMHGTDPYGSTRADPYNAHDSIAFYGPGVVVSGRVQVGLQYPPVTFLAALPGYLLGDVRYGYIAAIALSAVFVFALAPGPRGIVLAAFLLLNPVTFIMENRAWTEPLPWMLLCATVYAAFRKPRWLPLALGLFLAAKQYNFLALPFIPCLLRPCSWKACLRLMASSLAVAAATFLPFAVWNFRTLYHDLVLFHLAQPFRTDSLSFSVPFPPFLWIGPLLLLAFVIWGAWRCCARTAAFPLFYGLALLIFVSSSKQAFANYYFLVAQALLLGAVIWPGEEQSLAPSQLESIGN